MQLKRINDAIIYHLYDSLNCKKHFTLLLTLVLFILTTAFIPVNDYNYYNLYVKKNKYTLVCDNNFFPAPTSLYIGSKKYNFKIKDVQNTELVDNIKYYNLVIDISIPNNINKDNNIIPVKINKKKLSLLKKIINIVKG